MAAFAWSPLRALMKKAGAEIKNYGSIRMESFKGFNEKGRS